MPPLGLGSWKETTGHQLRWTKTGLIEFFPFSSHSAEITLVWSLFGLKTVQGFLGKCLLCLQSQGLQSKVPFAESAFICSKPLLMNLTAAVILRLYYSYIKYTSIPSGMVDSVELNPLSPTHNYDIPCPNFWLILHFHFAL